MGLQRQYVVMFLVVNIFSSHISTYLVVLNITTDWSSMTIGLGDESDGTFGTKFQRCVCRDTSTSTCRMSVTKVNKIPDHTSQETPTADNAATHTRDAFFQCEYWYNLNNVYCTQQGESSCPSSDCTINIIIMCTDDKNVVLSWKSTQQPAVLSLTEVTVINCCQSSTTTTEVTTISTTLTPTTFTSTQPTTLLTITTSVDSSTITSVGSVQSSSPTPDTITTNSTHWDTAHQQQEAGDASSHTSGQLIGIIVGTAVAAILITVLVIYIFWKLKTRREKNRRNEQTESALQVSGNLEEMRGNDLRHRANEGAKKTSKVVAHVSPLIQSHERESHLTQTPGDYTYIDIKSADSSKLNTAIASPSPVVEENHQNSTTAEVVPEMQDSEYSHLGTSKVRLENPYNVLDHQSHSTTIQPVIIPALPIYNRQHKRYLDTPYVHIMPANHCISHEIEQAIGENENNSLYSHLRESEAQQENTYNSLHRVNDQPIKEPLFTHQNCTTNQNSEIRAEPIPSPNQKLDIFSHTSKDKSMGIVDAAPSTHTAITPKTKREISNDSFQLKNALNQTAPSSDHPMLQEATSAKASTEINMTRGTVHGDKKNSKTEDEPGQAYANAVYSMHTCPQKSNTGFSLEAPEYANLA